MMALNDHIFKEMNKLNLIQCQRIPRRPGTEWRDLPDEKIKLSSGQTVDLIPWCLPNTARRHNRWKGLFGRLDLDGNFPYLCYRSPAHGQGRHVLQPRAGLHHHCS